MNYIQGEKREQIRMESIESYVEEESEVRVIDAIIDKMDIESLGFKVAKNNTTGRPAFNPRDLLKLYTYGYFNGIRSSRKLAQNCIINREVIWLLKDLKPKYRVISDFRKDNIDALEGLFNNFVLYCMELGLYGKELIAIDGTKLEASASKRKHYSRNKLDKMKEIVKSNVKEYFHDMSMIDKSEDDYEEQCNQIRANIKKQTEKLDYYLELENKMDELEENEINLTDSDARTVKFGAHQGTDVGYNIQAVVDAKNKLITTFEVSNFSADQGQLYNMASKAKEIYDVEKLEALADKGYFDSSDIAKCDYADIVTYVSKPVYSNQIGDSRYFTHKFKYNKDSDTYTCPEGKTLFLITKKADAQKKEYRNSDACNECVNRCKCTKAKSGRSIFRNEFSDNVDNLISRVENDKNKYSQRKSIVEHPFGTIKRSMNFTYLLLRNLTKVKGEVSLAFFSYNLKRVINILGVKALIESLFSNLDKIIGELNVYFYNLIHLSYINV